MIARDLRARKAWWNLSSRSFSAREIRKISFKKAHVVFLNQKSQTDHTTSLFTLHTLDRNRHFGYQDPGTYEFTDLFSRSAINLLTKYGLFSVRYYEEFGAHATPSGRQLMFSLAL